MECVICQAIENKGVTVYEDDKCSVLLLSKSLVLGHIKIVPKKHYNILEQIPDELLAYLMIVANKMASVLFDVLQLQGTNILIQNGVEAGQSFPHFSIDVIPRKANDGLNLQWAPNKISHELLESLKNNLITGMNNSQQPKVLSDSNNGSNDDSNSDSDDKPELDPKDNYLLKQLKFVP